MIFFIFFHGIFIPFSENDSQKSMINVLLLSNHSTPKGIQIHDSMSDEGQFGDSVNGAGDINNDGYADIIMGASSQDGGQGAAFVIFGQANSFSDNLDVAKLSSSTHPVGFQIFDSNFLGSLGCSVGGAGDINNDGYDDFIVSACTENSDSGAAYVIFGQSNPFPDYFDAAHLGSTSN